MPSGDRFCILPNGRLGNPGARKKRLPALGHVNHLAIRLPLALPSGWANASNNEAPLTSPGPHSFMQVSTVPSWQADGPANAQIHQLNATPKLTPIVQKTVAAPTAPTAPVKLVRRAFKKQASDPPCNEEANEGGTPPVPPGILSKMVRSSSTERLSVYIGKPFPGQTQHGSTAQLNSNIHAQSSSTLSSSPRLPLPAKKHAEAVSLAFTAAEPPPMSKRPKSPDERVRLHPSLVHLQADETSTDLSITPFGKIAPRMVQPLQLPAEFGLSPTAGFSFIVDGHPAVPVAAQPARQTQSRAPQRSKATLLTKTKIISENSVVTNRDGGGENEGGAMAAAASGVEEKAMDAPQMHHRTLGMVGSLQDWINNDKNGAQDVREPVKPQTRRSVLWGHPDELRFLLTAAKKYGLPIREVRDIYEDFKELDSKGNGSLSFQLMEQLIRKRGNLPADMPIPPHLVTNIEGLDVDGDGRISMDEFLQWHIKVMWSEEMLMPDPEERHLRQLAREHGMVLLDVERVKKMFNAFDTDGSGEIEEEEFRHILYKMLKVKNLSDLPVQRLQRYWREVDIDGSGAIGFREFLMWYQTSFTKDSQA